MNPNDPNLPLLKSVVRDLGELLERFVVVGGCTRCVPIRWLGMSKFVIGRELMLEPHPVEMTIKRGLAWFSDFVTPVSRARLRA